ncbi:3-dehydroquinate dehydratase [Betaproteobacteria bacterium]|nr:3-dehydroquinate dehydratase [Betaproteobacteria bacterium]
MKESRLIQVRGKPLGGGTLPAIITPLVGKTQAEVLDEVAAIVPKKPDLLEWRIDFFQAIGDIPAVIDMARAIRRAAGGIPVLLTRRNATEGGQPLSIDEPAVVAMYQAVCEARCVELIDYELSNRPEDIKALRAVSQANDIGMIMSYHNFQVTPDAATLDSKFITARDLGADVGKVAVMPTGERDVLELLAATSRAREAVDIPLISMSMGGVGSLSRIMGWVYGSAATFAVGKSSSAPGQVAIEDLRTALAIVRQAVLGK